MSSSRHLGFVLLFVSSPVLATPEFVEMTSTLGFSGAWTPSVSDIDGLRAGGAAVLDYDNDGDEDLYVVCNDDAANQLYRNNLDLGFGLGFTEVGVAAGVASTSRTFGVLAADLDNDGDTDLLLLNDGTDTLYENNGDGTFTDSTVGSGFDTSDLKAFSAGAADYDLDGDLDVYIGNYEYDPAFSINALWRNNGDLTFTDVTATAGVGDSELTLGCGWADLNEDGYPDVYSVNEFVADKLYMNDGDGTFTDVTATALLPASSVAAGDGMGIAFGDHNFDGLTDIYITNVGPNNLYQNNGDGTFNDVAVALGCSGPTDQFRIGWGVEFFDCELDGDIDIFNANGHMVHGTPNFLWIGDSGGYTGAVDAGGADADLVSRGSVMADFDRDGDLDIFLVNQNPPETPATNRFYLNTTDQSNNWLSIGVTGTTSNTDGVGARVLVTDDGVTWEREVAAGLSYCSSISKRIHVGLGDRTSVDLVRVEWPSGIVDESTDVPVNRRIDIVEGAGGVVSVEPATPTVAKPHLAVRPNPARGTSVVSFTLESAIAGHVVVVGIDGREVASLGSGSFAAGDHRIGWDGTTTDGAITAPGVYFVMLVSPEVTASAKLVRE